MIQNNSTPKHQLHKPKNNMIQNNSTPKHMMCDKDEFLF